MCLDRRMEREAKGTRKTPNRRGGWMGKTKKLQEGYVEVVFSSVQLGLRDNSRTG